MRNTIAFLFLASVLAAFSGRAQSSSSYTTRWMVKPSVGYYFPTTRLLKGAITDNLMAYDDHSFYWQVLTATWFFRQHWGLEANYQAGSSPHISGRADRFLQDMRDQYGNAYFVTASTGAEYPEPSPVLGQIERGFLGVVYRIENCSFLVYPKVAMGVTSFYTDWGRAYLKEKNTNQVYEVFYWTGAPTNDFLTVAASATAAYKLGKRVYLDAELLGTYYRANFTYSKVLKDLNTGATETEYTRYRKNVFNLGIGGGLIVVLK